MTNQGRLRVMAVMAAAVTETARTGRRRTSRRTSREEEDVEGRTVSRVSATCIDDRSIGPPQF